MSNCLAKLSVAAFPFAILSNSKYDLFVFCSEKIVITVTDANILLRHVSVFGNQDMGTQKGLWNFANKFFTFGVVGLYITDRFASVAPVRGSSMSPTLNPGTTKLMGLSTGWYLKRCLKQIAFRCIVILDLV